MASLRGESEGFLFLLFIFGYMGLRCLQGLSLVTVSGGCSLGAGHRLLLGRLLLSRSLGSAAQAPWSWPTGLAAREAIPRQVDRKSGVCEEERGGLQLTKRSLGSEILTEEED